jgi:hypothetical protein
MKTGFMSMIILGERQNRFYDVRGVFLTKSKVSIGVTFYPSEIQDLGFPSSKPVGQKELLSSTACSLESVE